MSPCLSLLLGIKMWYHPMITTTGGVTHTLLSYSRQASGRTAITPVLLSGLMGWIHFMKRFLARRLFPEQSYTRVEHA